MDSGKLILSPEDVGRQKFDPYVKRGSLFVPLALAPKPREPQLSRSAREKIRRDRETAKHRVKQESLLKRKAFRNVQEILQRSKSQ
jgi:hypothetical protein